MFSSPATQIVKMDGTVFVKNAETKGSDILVCQLNQNGKNAKSVGKH